MDKEELGVDGVCNVLCSVRCSAVPSSLTVAGHLVVGYRRGGSGGREEVLNTVLSTGLNNRFLQLNTIG